MGQIYISKETYEKNKARLSNGAIKLLFEKFDPDRSISAKKQSKQRVKTLNKKDRVSRDATSVPKISDEEWERIKENANRKGNPLELKEELENQRKYRALINTYGTKNAKAAIRNKPISKKDNKKNHKKKKYIEIKRKGEDGLRNKSSRPLYNPEGKDLYDLAGEYQARNIQFGYGRKKSKEWKGAIYSGTGGSISYIRRLQHEDPNVLDRQAMK